MKFYRKALILFLCAVAFLWAAVFTACTHEEASSGSSAAADGESAVPEGLEDLGIDPKSVGVTPNIIHDKKNDPGFQLKAPNEGDTIAVMHTSMGNITIRFFPEEAPKTVTNFINLVKTGAYNKTSFHKVVGDTLIQGGYCGYDENNPNGVSSFGAPFEDEFGDSLLNLRGAVAMANSAKDSNGSQFLINQTTPEAFKKSGGWRALQAAWVGITDKLRDYKDSDLLQAYVEENGDRFLNPAVVPGNVQQLYNEYGGNPLFDGIYNAADRGCTVFAQVIDGMDVVDKINAVKVDDNGAPLESVVIESIEISVYTAKKAV